MSQTKKIESLPQEQIDKFPEYIRKWTEIGLCTEPANREEAEKAINKSYILSGFKPPQKIVWCDSPLSQGLTRAIILDKKLIHKIGDPIKTLIWNSVGDSVGKLIKTSIRQSALDSVNKSIFNSIKDSVWNSVFHSIGTTTLNSVGYSIRDSIVRSVWKSVKDSASKSVAHSVMRSVSDSVWDSVVMSIWDPVGYSVENLVRDLPESSLEASVWESGYGQHDANWLAFYSFFRNECGLVNETEKLTGLMELAHHCGWYIPHENICWVSERHNLLKRDEQGRLHSINGPSVMYPDGWKIYAVKGVVLSEWIIEEPHKITIDHIEKESNAEIKRVMIDQYDRDFKGRYLKDSGASLIHKDKFGELYKKEIPDDEPLVMVKVLNSTPEPDGSIKEYFLRVPPGIEKAEDAVAWTFGFENKEYKPVIET